jgi:ubiquinone/menaquinone biosynthesis C-methylase UbiE
METSGKFFHEFADTFDTFYDGKRSPMMQWIDRKYRSDMFLRFSMAFDFLGDLNGKSVLDIGCGSGPYVAEALKRGAAHVTGLDPAPNMLALAKQRVAQLDMLERARFVEGYFPDESPKETFDHAIVMGVLDYVHDAHRFIDGVRRVVTVGATISFPSTHWFRGPVRMVRYKLRNCPLFLYDVEKIIRIMQAASVKNYKILKLPGAGMDYVVCLTC